MNRTSLRWKPRTIAAQALGTIDLAVVGLLFARDQAKNGALARAVGPDEPDLLAVVQLEKEARR